MGTGYGYFHNGNRKSTSVWRENSKCSKIMFFERLNSPIVLRMTVGLSALHRNIIIGRHDVFKEGCFTKEDGSLRLSSSLPLLCSRYHVLSMIGEGTFSQIFLCQDTFSPNKTNIILKVLRTQYDYIGYQEIRILQILNSADYNSSIHVIRIVSTPFLFHSHICIPLSLLGSPINNIISTSLSDTTSQVRNISLQLLFCFCFLKNNGILHLDLKPDNVLLTHPNVIDNNHNQSCINIKKSIKFNLSSDLVKPSLVYYCRSDSNNQNHLNIWSPHISLIDFGNSVEISNIDKYILSGNIVQSLPYRSPEVLLQLPFGFPAEIWSLGCFIIEMLSGEALFNPSSSQNLYNEMVDLFGPFPLNMTCKSTVFAKLHSGYLNTLSSIIPPSNDSSTIFNLPSSKNLLNSRDVDYSNKLKMKLVKITGKNDPELLSLLMGLLNYDPKKRLTAHQSLSHPFFNSILPLDSIMNNNNSCTQENIEKVIKKRKS